MKRLNVLINAVLCNPYGGSESATGWNIVTRIAQHHNVTVITGDLARTQPNYQEYAKWTQAGHSIAGLTYAYVPPTPAITKLEQMHHYPGLRYLWYMAYKRWQWQAYLKALQLTQTQHFDLVHHLNVNGYREPGYMWKLDLPFFWGPVSGADQIPLAYSLRMGTRMLYPVASKILNHIKINYLPGRVKLAARRACHVWTVTRSDAEMFQRQWGVGSENLPESGTAAATAKPYPQPARPAIQLMWSGVFIERKALDLLLQALARLKQYDRQWQLLVLGSGPCEQEWKRLAASLGLDKNIVWQGHVPRAQGLELLRNSDVFIHSSLKEGTPMVILEALENGVPVICHDACGMGTTITDACGIKVPMTSPEASIAGFARAIERIITNPDLIPQLSRGATARANELTWDKTARIISEKYSSLINHD